MANFLHTVKQHYNNTSIILLPNTSAFFFLLISSLHRLWVLIAWRLQQPDGGVTFLLGEDPVHNSQQHILTHSVTPPIPDPHAEETCPIRYIRTSVQDDFIRTLDQLFIKDCSIFALPNGPTHYCKAKVI
jgi:hypothetical protein